jgi:rod shape-determining protein MreC
VPIGYVTKVERTPGELSTKALVSSYVDYTALDFVGVVVERTRDVPRDSLLPASPTPSPDPSESTAPNDDATTGREDSSSASPSATATP